MTAFIAVIVIGTCLLIWLMRDKSVCPYCGSKDKVNHFSRIPGLKTCFNCGKTYDAWRHQP